MTRKPYTYTERLAIENMLNDGCSIKDIEYDIKRTSSGIVKEINKHISFVYPSIYNGQHICLKWETCKVRERDCHIFCKNFTYKICPKLQSSPHVCNGCITKGGCRYVKSYYKARQAHDEYKELLIKCRKGLHYTEQEMLILNDVLCPLIVKSKSVYHAIITINSIYETNYVLKTLYWQINNNFLPIKSSDLPRSNRQISNEEKDKNYKRNIEDHEYEDYLKCKKEHPNYCETQMDTVEGIKENNAPVLLTLEIVEIKFLIAFKIDSQTKNEVVKMLNHLKEIIGEEIYEKIMKILLTDNGKEFIDSDLILSTCSSINIFYCHPYSSFEKGHIENKHELLRRVIPKGISLKPYTQKDINLLCSHINSLYIESLNGKCPFDLIEKYIPLNILQELGLKRINPLDVDLTPELLGEKNVENIKKYLSYDDMKKANITLKKW